MADNFGEEIDLEDVQRQDVMDTEKVKADEKQYKDISVIKYFTDENGVDKMEETILANYRRIVAETKQLVKDEIVRIEADFDLCHLLEDAE